MKSQNVETEKTIAVLNYQSYCIINFFMDTVQNTKFQSFQHWLAETAAYKDLPSSTNGQQGDYATATQECTWS